MEPDVTLLRVWSLDARSEAHASRMAALLKELIGRSGAAISDPGRSRSVKRELRHAQLNVVTGEHRLLVYSLPVHPRPVR